LGAFDREGSCGLFALQGHAECRPYWRRSVRRSSSAERSSRSLSMGEDYHRQLHEPFQPKVNGRFCPASRAILSCAGTRLTRARIFDRQARPSAPPRPQRRTIRSAARGNGTISATSVLVGCELQTPAATTRRVRAIAPPRGQLATLHILRSLARVDVWLRDASCRLRLRFGAARKASAGSFEYSTCSRLRRPRVAGSSRNGPRDLSINLFR
jgi:hypothetical protein